MNKRQNGLGVGQSGDPAYTLDQTGAQAVAHPVPYDLFQITAPVNRQNRKPGDPCHTLARDNAAHAAVAFSSNMSVPDCQTDGSTPTLKCGGSDGGNPPAVAFPIDGRNAMRDADKLDAINRQGMGVGATGDPSHTVTSACVHAVAFTRCDDGRDATEDKTPTMRCGSNYSAHLAVAFRDPSPTLTARMQGSSGWAPANEDAHLVGQPVAPTLTAANDPSRSPQSSEITQQVAAVHATTMAVRRLTPVECERLQGFPDGYTAIPWRGKGAEDCPDGPRYRALGNSMAVPVMRWIGERIAQVEALSISVTGDANVQ